MGSMIYLAIDKKSNFLTRVAALSALAIMIITVMVCLVMILTDDRVPVDPSNLIVGAPAAVKEESNSLLGLLFSIVFLLALFIVISFLAIKEHKKNVPKKDEVVF